MRKPLLLTFALVAGVALHQHDARVSTLLHAQAGANVVVNPNTYQDLRWRSIGPHRGGRSTAAAGVRTQPNVFYMGATGGGVWKTENYGITWTPITDGQIATGSIGAIDVSDSNPNVIYVGTGSEAIRSQRDPRARRVQVDRRRQDVAARRAARRRPDRPGQDSSEEPRHRRTSRRSAIRSAGDRSAASTGRRTAARPGRKCSSSTTRPASSRSRSTGRTRTRSTPARGARSASRGRSSAAARRPKAASTRRPTAATRWTRVSQRLPRRFDRQGLGRRRAVEPEGRLRAGRGEGREGRALSLGRQRRHLDAGQQQPDDPRAAVLLQQGLRQPEGRERSLRHRARLPSIDRRRQDVHHHADAARRRPRRVDQSRQPEDLHRDQRRRRERHAGRRQELVDADESADRRVLHGGRRRAVSVSASTARSRTTARVYVANVPPFSWPPDEPTQTWFQASGCESGQIRPTPDGKIIYGDCKGEFGRYNVETGQEQHYWIYPQQRYGKNPKEMRYRFVRQAPIEVDAHNPKIVYHGSQYVHKTIDGGIHWTRFSPDVTANGPEGHVTSGEPITRDMTGEEVYAALYSMRSSRLEPGVFWTGSNDGPVWMTRDGGKTWKNVTPADLPPGGRVHTIEDSPHRRGSAYVSVYRMYLNDFKPYLYMTNDYGAALDAADRRHATASPPISRCTSCARIRSRKACCTPARSRARTSRSIRASTGRRCSRTCRRRRSPTSRSTTAISSRRRWGGRSGSWTTSRRCARSRRA